jgi:MoaA/NifB/PqqE/SkfB family radical SAM enzyme
MKRVDIKTGFNCNNHCRFCVQGNKRTLYGSKTTEEIKKILQEAREDCDSVVFTGGELTIREDIIALVSYAKKLKFETIQMQTNGRMFCYKEFCDEIIAAGANEFSPAIHGHTAELHDYLTCSGKFSTDTLRD